MAGGRSGADHLCASVRVNPRLDCKATLVCLSLYTNTEPEAVATGSGYDNTFVSTPDPVATARGADF